MGQYWNILNLDKREQVAGGKLGEDLPQISYYDLFSLLFRRLGNPKANATGSWAGDRIINVGDYATDYPEGVLTADEEKELEKREYNGLYDYADQHYITVPRLYARDMPGPPWVLRNLSTHEYVHSDAVEIVNAGPHERCIPGLMEALMIRLCWSSDPSISMRYEARWPGVRPLHRGFWAGHRFEIIPDSDLDVKAGWTNVSAAVRRELFAIWASEFGDYDVSSWKTKSDEAQRSANVQAPFPKLNLDVVRYILEAAATDDIVDATAFSRVSSLINEWIKPIIYRSVIVESTSKLKSFCKALRSYPHLGQEIHRLFILADNDRYEPNPTSPEVILAAIKVCANLEVLITDIKMPPITFEDEEPSGSPWSALQHIMAIPDTRILPPTSHPLLQNVTRLCLDLMDWDALMSLPETLSRLTHLALFSSLNHKSRDDPPASQRIEGLLQSNTKLRLLLLVARGFSEYPGSPLVGREWAEIAKIKDERLFARRGLDTEDYQGMKYGATLFDDVERKYADWRNTVYIKSTTNSDEEEEDYEEDDDEDDHEEEGDNYDNGDDDDEEEEEEEDGGGEKQKIPIPEPQ